MGTLQISIRHGRADDLTALQKLFTETVSVICSKDYDQDQIRVWMSSIENKDRWLDIVTNQFILVAEVHKQIVGFCTLDKESCIDLLYVHKDYQRKGIAYQLYLEIEKEARRKEQRQLNSDVSLTAVPFFEKIGFKVMTKQTVVIRGIKLTNFKMIKELAI